MTDRPADPIWPEAIEALEAAKAPEPLRRLAACTPTLGPRLAELLAQAAGCEVEFSVTVYAEDAQLTLGSSERAHEQAMHAAIGRQVAQAMAQAMPTQGSA